MGRSASLLGLLGLLLLAFGFVATAFVEFPASDPFVLVNVILGAGLLLLTVVFGLDNLRGLVGAALDALRRERRALLAALRRPAGRAELSRRAPPPSLGPHRERRLHDLAPVEEGDRLPEGQAGRHRLRRGRPEPAARDPARRLQVPLAGPGRDPHRRSRQGALARRADEDHHRPERAPPVRQGELRGHAANGGDRHQRHHPRHPQRQEADLLHRGLRGAEHPERGRPEGLFGGEARPRAGELRGQAAAAPVGRADPRRRERGGAGRTHPAAHRRGDRGPRRLPEARRSSAGARRPASGLQGGREADGLPRAVGRQAGQRHRHRPRGPPLRRARDSGSSPCPARTARIRSRRASRTSRSFPRRRASSRRPRGRRDSRRPRW